MSCGCDFDRPKFYHVTEPKARRGHKCSECSCDIRIGETYERVQGKWEDELYTFKTCSDCLKVREVLERAECYCLVHGQMYEDAHDFIQEMPSKDRVAMLRVFSMHRYNKKEK